MSTVKPLVSVGPPPPPVSLSQPPSPSPAPNPTSPTTGRVNFIAVNLAASDLLHLNSAPKTLIAAPGIGKAIWPLSLICVYKFGTAAFANVGSGILINWAGVTGGDAFAGDATLWALTTDQIENFASVYAKRSLANVENLALVAHDTQDWTTGDGAAVINLTYAVISTK